MPAIQYEEAKTTTNCTWEPELHF